MSLLIISLLSIFLVPSSFSWETDQYTLPDEPLADIGNEISQFLVSNLEIAVEDYNLNYSHQLNLTIKQQHKLISSLVFSQIAPKIANEEHRDAIWGEDLSFLNSTDNRKNGKLVLFFPGKMGTVYTYAGFHRVLSSSYYVHSSTIKAYGVEFGLDKLGHTFDVGFDYYKIYNEGLSAGYSNKTSLKMSVDHGVLSEKTYYGKIVSGVYSSGDLAANLTGFLFYRNLFEDISFNNKLMKKILVRKPDGRYIVSQKNNDITSLYKRLVSIHLNEAFNPSEYEFFQRLPIKIAVEARCDSWMTRYPLYLKQDYINISNRVKKLHGYNYGHRGNNVIAISDSR